MRKTASDIASSLPDIRRELYNAHDVVSNYSSRTYFTPGERKIRDLLLTDLKHMDMLDIGVGAGRSTEHFAPLVRSYSGVDIAEGMIAACSAKFPKYKFIVSDAANLAQLDNRSFDFILFSDQGIDHLTNEDRNLALREFYRLLRAGGWLAYSSHNINVLPTRAKELRPRLSRHPLRFAVQFHLYLQFIVRNFRKPGPDAPWHVGYEVEMGRSGIPMMYVRPDAEIKLLTKIGFDKVWPIPNKGGNVVDVAMLATIFDPHIYYFCQKPKG